LGSNSLNPDRFESVFWIAGNPPVALAIVLCPRGDVWLKDELREIRRAGVDILVSLLEPSEANWLGLGDEEKLANEVGLNFLSYPIRDVHVPADIRTFQAFVAEVASSLRDGKKVGMHCRGSIGRAPTTAACTLIQLGWGAKDAVAAIRKARGYPIPDTDEQVRWILNYKAQP
jgi:protein-tyrosine phosphatase